PCERTPGPGAVENDAHLALVEGRVQEALHQPSGAGHHLEGAMVCGLGVRASCHSLIPCSMLGARRIPTWAHVDAKAKRQAAGRERSTTAMEPRRRPSKERSRPLELAPGGASPHTAGRVSDTRGGGPWT